MARPTGTWLFAEMFFSADGKQWSTEFWFDGAAHAQPAAFDPNALAVSIQAAYAAGFESILPNVYSCIGTRVEANFGGGTFGGETHDSFVGSNINPPIPEDVCVVVRKQTQTGGPSGSGRWRLSGLGIDCLNGSYLSAPGAFFIADLITQFVTPITDQGITWTPQVYSAKNNLLIKITAAVADLLLGTARRRRTKF